MDKSKDRLLKTLIGATVPLSIIPPYGSTKTEYKPRVPTVEENKIFNRKKKKKTISDRSKKINRQRSKR